MKRYAVIAGAVALVALIAAAIIPMWVMTAGVSLPPAASAPSCFMIIGCFGGRRRADVPDLLQRAEGL